ncbi:ELWxxDGT repeat protein [Pyxidicoccus sp. 3LG]
MGSSQKLLMGLAALFAVVGGCSEPGVGTYGENGFRTQAGELAFSPAERVRDINPLPIPGAGSQPNFLTAVNGALFFQARHETLGSELWRSDGTPEGTVVLDLVTGSANSAPNELTDVNGTLFFDGFWPGTEALWKSDGTPQGTVRVRDFPVVIGTQGLDWLTNVDGTLFFTAPETGKPSRLWRSDGTTAGTLKLADVVVLPATQHPRHLAQAAGKVYFRSTDGVNGYELWKSDGTPAGTGMVKDLWPGAADSLPAELTGVGGTLFFTADDGGGTRCGRRTGRRPARCPSRIERSSPIPGTSSP